MKNVLGLIFIVEADLSRPLDVEVHVGDSSDGGYSLMACSKTKQAVRRELQHMEKWRFIQSDEPTFDTPNCGGPDVTEETIEDGSFLGTAANAGAGARTRYGLDLHSLTSRRASGEWRRKESFWLGTLCHLDEQS